MADPEGPATPQNAAHPSLSSESLSAEGPPSASSLQYVLTDANAAIAYDVQFFLDDRHWLALLECAKPVVRQQDVVRALTIIRAFLCGVWRNDVTLVDTHCRTLWQMLMSPVAGVVDHRAAILSLLQAVDSSGRAEVIEQDVNTLSVAFRSWLAAYRAVPDEKSEASYARERGNPQRDVIQRLRLRQALANAQRSAGKPDYAAKLKAAALQSQSGESDIELQDYMMVDDGLARSDDYADIVAALVKPEEKVDKSAKITLPAGWDTLGRLSAYLQASLKHTQAEVFVSSKVKILTELCAAPKFWTEPVAVATQMRAGEQRSLADDHIMVLSLFHGLIQLPKPSDAVDTDSPTRMSSFHVLATALLNYDQVVNKGEISKTCKLLKKTDSYRSEIVGAMSRVFGNSIEVVNVLMSAYDSLLRREVRLLAENASFRKHMKGVIRVLTASASQVVTHFCYTKEVVTEKPNPEYREGPHRKGEIPVPKMIKSSRQEPVLPHIELGKNILLAEEKKRVVSISESLRDIAHRMPKEDTLSEQAEATKAFVAAAYHLAELGQAVVSVRRSSMRNRIMDERKDKRRRENAPAVAQRDEAAPTQAEVDAICPIVLKDEGLKARTEQKLVEAEAAHQAFVAKYPKTTKKASGAELADS